MILQSSTLSVKSGMASEFESSFRKAQKLLAGTRGYISHELHKCVEREGRYMLLVRWQSIGDHVVGFMGSPAQGEWQAALNEFYEREPESDHYIRIRLD
ncbi:antibiotic biosynthesis monooxygenase family protein [Cohnella rhizosphaerae]|uniref:Antibiotic biosynthesis monooxygenase n=1 Tax=Cohnella rhizosphaerae TaxID=1457232 RepID=A0A9X4QVD9_9BACL|nr:antibiotic biosynthesis monooxygenase [Cohnella rhizosphaerae]MDG0812519.1 antibiotic biosynthesis monooxygenase [Cohnella rhizosphaerae]